MLHMLGVIAQRAEMLPAQHVADPEPRFVRNRKDDRLTRNTRQIAHSGPGIVKMLQHFETRDHVEAARGERERLHTRADAMRLGDFGKRVGPQIEAYRMQPIRQNAPPQHLALPAPRIQHAARLQLRHDPSQAIEETPDHETHYRIFVVVLFLPGHYRFRSRAAARRRITWRMYCNG